MGSLIIWGAGGHAKVLADAARMSGWRIEAFLDDLQPARNGEAFFDSVVYGDLKAFEGNEPVAIGLGIGDCRTRLACADRARQQGWTLPVIIHPRACVSSTARVEEGAFLAAGAVVNPDSELARAAIVNTAATVDHDCRIGAGVHLAPGVHLAGGVSIGARTLIGLGAVVKPGVRIGDDCIVGAGAVVTRDLPNGVTVAGVPARRR